MIAVQYRPRLTVNGIEAANGSLLLHDIVTTPERAACSISQVAVHFRSPDEHSLKAYEQRSMDLGRWKEFVPPYRDDERSPSISSPKRLRSMRNRHHTLRGMT